MTTTAIVIAVLGCLFVLVAVTFTLQQIEKNNEQKAALVATLKGQARNFQYMLEGFPEGLLNRDLQLLVCQCLGETLEQLVKLDHKNPQHRQLQRQVAEKTKQLQAAPANAGSYQPLTDPAQIQEVQKLLNSLFNVVQRLYQSKRLNSTQANNYAAQVQQLATRIALDTSVSAAQAAQQSGKPRLAIHHYQLAIGKMSKANGDGRFTEQIAQLQLRCAQLEAQANQQEQPSAVSADWKAFEKNAEEGTKKKTIYD